MVIKTQELNPLQGEYQIFCNEVFLEKSDKPSSFTASGIPMGILLLTNKRLFFFNESQGVSKWSLSFRSLKSDFSAGVTELLRKRKDLDTLANKEHSFVVPIERISSYEKSGGFSNKKRFTRFSVSETDNTNTDYCIYARNPRDSSDLSYHEIWFNAIDKIVGKK